MSNITLNVNHMMSEYLGDRGIRRDEMEKLSESLKNAHARVEANRGKGMQGWMDLPYNQNETLTQIEDCAKEIRQKFETFVVLGIGGSALGPAAVQRALNHLNYNELPAHKRQGPRLYIVDNIDPERMAALFDIIDLEHTCFNVISKSGETAETMSQYLIVLDKLKAVCPDDYKDHIIITCSATRGLLRELADRDGYRSFCVPDGVGGRFSELSPVGLLAAAVCAIDIRGLVNGARSMDERCKNDPTLSNMALYEAGLMYLCMKHGKNISVMMPYADSLALMGDWYAQLWAESLGKNKTLDGASCNVGSTPVKALGVTDQHSQLQLYTEGPFDKVVTFLKVEHFRKYMPIPNGYSYAPKIEFLSGKSHNRLIEAERKGTEYALYKAGRMSQTITLDEVNADTVGQLLYFFELVTAYTGALLNIDAFNQPGVEESKVAAYAVMGYESEIHNKKRLEMNERPAEIAEYIF